MKREDFLARLKCELGDITREDIEQIEDFYEELILDGMEQGYTEEEVLARFGSPEDVARQVRREYGGMIPYTSKMRQEPGYEASNMVHTVIVDVSNLRINVRTVENGPIRVLFHPRENSDKVTFTEEKGVFSFVHRTKGLFHLNWLNLFMDYNLLILEIPRSFGGTLKLKTSNAQIRVSNLSSLSSGEFVSANGKIKAENIKADVLTVRTSNSRLELSGLSGKRLEAVTNNGPVSAKECSFPEEVVLQTKNGGVSCRNLVGDSIQLQTCNGSVTGTIIGNVNDYAIHSSTMNGSNNLRDTAGESYQKSLTAKTVNGQIHLEFVQ